MITSGGGLLTVCPILAKEDSTNVREMVVTSTPMPTQYVMAVDPSSALASRSNYITITAAANIASTTATLFG